MCTRLPFVILCLGLDLTCLLYTSYESSLIEGDQHAQKTSHCTLVLLEPVLSSSTLWVCDHTCRFQGSLIAPPCGSEMLVMLYFIVLDIHLMKWELLFRHFFYPFLYRLDVEWCGSVMSCVLYHIYHMMVCLSVCLSVCIYVRVYTCTCTYMPIPHGILKMMI